MKTNRRTFLKTLGATGVGATLAPAGLASATSVQRSPLPPAPAAGFNMCGYRAPKIETVRVGVIGLGDRGSGAVKRLARVEGLQIAALCDLRPARIDAALRALSELPVKPKTFTGKEDAWHALAGDPAIDLVYICTPWKLHTPMAVRAMEHGKHAATEVPAATTVEDCWRLVETSEKTRRHCMMLENCCYDFFELLTLKMAREGFFGEIIHCEGAYLHDLQENTFSRTKKWNNWRLRENVRNGNLYPTHGLGPIAQILGLNRGDRMEHLVSVSSNDYHMKAKAQELAKTDEYYAQFAKLNFRGNINTSVVRTYRGRTLMIQHDVTTPRPYSRIHLVSGTKATAQKYPVPSVSIEHKWATPAQLKQLEQKYTPDLVRQMGTIAKKVGGHGGMDYLMDWRLTQLLRNGEPLDMDVYDAALWSVIAPLSEWSVANGSQPIEVPDFTRGAWQTNQPLMV